MERRLAVTTALFRGHASHRLIASRFPPIGIFDSFNDLEAARAALELESATDDRLNDVAGRLSLMAPADILLGVPTAHQIMAAFLHPAPGGGRFNKDRLGAWYASLDLKTAVAETLHHHALRLRRSAGGFPNSIVMRQLITRPRANLVDIRKQRQAALYHREDYTDSQTFGERCRADGHDGIWYRSLRRSGGENIVIFRPKLLPPVVQGTHYRYDWSEDGTAIVSEIRAVSRE